MIPQQILQKLLRAYWETYRPAEYYQLTDPETFLAMRMHEVTLALKTILTEMQPTPTSTDYLTNLGELNCAKSAALEAALLDLLPPPETTLSESNTPDRRTQLVTEFLAELP